MVDTNDEGTENNKDEEILEAFSLSSKGLETPAAGVGLPIADGSCAGMALEMGDGDSPSSDGATPSSS